MGTRSLIGGVRWKRRAAQAGSQPVTERRGPLSSELADLGRLQRELDRARARYERAIAELDEASDGLEWHARVRASAQSAMPRPEGKGTGSPDEERISLSSATLDDLRSLGLSTTQSTTLLELRADGALDSTAGLDRVPGFPRAQLIELKSHLRD